VLNVMLIEMREKRISCAHNITLDWGLDYLKIIEKDFPDIGEMSLIYSMIQKKTKPEDYVTKLTIFIVIC